VISNDEGFGSLVYPLTVTNVAIWMIDCLGFVCSRAGVSGYIYICKSLISKAGVSPGADYSPGGMSQNET
jgi:hypothetical protein